MDRVWLVTLGEYLVCACPSEDEAKAVAALIEGNVEDVPLATAADVHVVSRLTMRCTIERTSGAVLEEREWVLREWAIGKDPGAPTVRVEEPPWQRGYEYEGYVAGSDHERVRKAYSDSKAKTVAQAMES